MSPAIVPRLLAAHNVRIPELAVTYEPIWANQSFLGEPVLVIEILPLSNQADTWNNVWAYATIPSVQEILILRSDRIAADLLRRLPNQAWPDEPISITEGALTLDSIGFEVPLAGPLHPNPVRPLKTCTPSFRGPRPTRRSPRKSM